jgi:hypothetical protein
MDLAMVKQEHGEALRKYMRRFFDKRATVVDVTDKEVIDLFQDGLYHRRSFEDFSHRRPSSITELPRSDNTSAISPTTDGMPSRRNSPNYLRLASC